MTFEVWPGVPYPLGAHLDAQGVNFAVVSENATGVTLCLFDPEDPQKELARLPFSDVTQHVWHGYVPGLKAGALYGFRVEGPWAPDKGHYFNSKRLLVDPYAKALSGALSWHEPLTAHVPGDQTALKRDDRETGAGVPRSVVVDDRFDWSGETRPEVIWRKTILYEAHVKGFTARHPGIPEALRGTYAGLAHPAAIDHLTSLGVTSVELLPVHERVSEGFLSARGLSNFWGYNTIGFFAPDQRFSSSGNRGQQVTEFKAMVKSLHAAGIEVILDVVFNHTGEGNHEGPSLSMRGIDASSYYWLNEHGRHIDFTGCGNSLNLNSPTALKLVMDSLRYWVSEMHVDGFRFDLATEMGRTRSTRFHPRAAFFQSLHQDPLLSRVKVIAEPWDLGPDGYRVGHFPPLWAEWNDKYRSSVRRFWRGDAGQVPELGNRVSGSSDLFRGSGRRPTASINYVACHDGFTLRDLVSYARKHNELNAEDNRDGTDENHSFNCGVEGETTDGLVNSLRLRQQKNFLATLFLSVGTPMLTAGDELSRTQLGNNNAYCQDNNLGYVDWEGASQELLAFTRKVISLRKSQPVIQRRNFFLGETLEDSRFRDLVWFRNDGREMKHEDWQFSHAKCLGWFLGGDAIATRNPRGHKMAGDSLLIFLNSGDASIEITVPDKQWGEAWEVALATADDPGDGQSRWYAPGEAFVLPGRALICMRQAAKPS